MKDNLKFTTTCCLLLIFVGIFILSRAPFYNKQQIYEEGIFSYIFVNHPQKPNYGLMARIHGRNVLMPLEHPSLMYEFISLTGYVIDSFTNIKLMSEKKRTSIIRFSFSLSWIIISLLTLLFIIYNQKEVNILYYFIMLILVMSTPIAMVTSTELQLDNSFGLLTAGLLAIGLMITTTRDYNTKKDLIITFASSFLLSLGKNEWTFILFLSYLIMLIYLVIYKDKITLYNKFRVIFVIGMVGMIAGNIVSYLFDPDNYVKGLRLIMRLSSHSMFNPSTFVRWIELTKIRLPFILPIMGLLLLIYFIIIKNYKKFFNINPVIFFLTIFSSFIFTSYFFCAWETTPRYFVIPYIVSFIAFSGVIDYISITKRKLIMIAFSFFLLWNIFTFNYLSERYLYVAKPVTENNRGYDTRCLRIMDVADAYFDKNIDFVGSSLSKEYQKDLSEKYHFPLCDDINVR